MKNCEARRLKSKTWGALGSFMLSGGVFKFGTGWGKNLKYGKSDIQPAGEAERRVFMFLK
jgi:hypothetical protein